MNNTIIHIGNDFLVQQQTKQEMRAAMQKAMIKAWEDANEFGSFLIVHKGCSLGPTTSVEHDVKPLYHVVYIPELNGSEPQIEVLQCITRIILFCSEKAFKALKHSEGKTVQQIIDEFTSQPNY